MASSRLFVLAAAISSAVISGCSCGDSLVTVEPDSGEPLVECVTTADCRLGESCVSGECVLGEVDDGGVDAGVECTEHSDCPQGFVCLKSESRCIAQENPPDAGEADAGVLTCFENDTRPCGPSKLGECRLGTETCASNAWGSCVGAVLPTSEACDQKDNDCNGLVDDPYNKLTDVNHCGLCGRVCSYANATPLCADGNCAMGPCNAGFVDLNMDPTDGCEYACSVSNGGAEICDGRDNDCDGQTDENLADLSCGQGACAKTVTACVSGQPQTCTPGSPTAEVCDGIDNNCDGTADNGLPNLTCGRGECFRSVPACNGSQPNSCVAGTGNSPDEVCTPEFKGKDDDCDGMVDENCACSAGETQSCYSGSPFTLGKGVCVAGTQSCNSGAWSSCAGEVKDSPEICDGKDNDCDGETDEGLPVLNCGTGACARTVSTCVNGQPNSTCTPGNPSTEVCDNVDNDCDNVTDEGTLTCGTGVCLVTVNMCLNGADNSCTPGAPQTEICDGLDNDCDMATDESYPQMGQSCSTGQQGLCATGARSCTSGTLGCQQTVFPANEVCNNNLDENCNGVNDDPLACGCDNTIDRDLDGVSQCFDCNDTDGTIKPDAGERCNGRDDNCNQQIDETFDKDSDTFTTCGTVPGGGIDTTRIDCNDDAGFVFPGKVTDCGNAATPTSPNSVDDNCNGYVDETCNCDNVDRDGDGLSQCQGDCAPNDGAIRPGRTETCDGKDNDCDKDTVDNCGVSEPCGSKSGNSYVAWPAGTDRCKPDLLCTRNNQTGALTCGSLCNQTQGLGLGDSCAAGEGCNVPLLDTDALAVCRVTPVGTRLTGASCSLDSECRTGDCTGTNGYCTDRCTHQSGCSANTTCTPTKYVTDYQGVNPIGYLFSGTCKLNSAISGTRTLGEACNGSTTAPECKAGVEACFNGKCTVPCCATSECGSGYGCSLAGPRVFTGYTSSNGQIYSAYAACLPSTGKTQGQVCATSAECKSGICDKAAGTCVDVCCNDTSCTNGTSCELVDFKWSDGKVSGVRVCMKLPLPAILEQK